MFNRWCAEVKSRVEHSPASPRGRWCFITAATCALCPASDARAGGAGGAAAHGAAGQRAAAAGPAAGGAEAAAGQEEEQAGASRRAGERRVA